MDYKNKNYLNIIVDYFNSVTNKQKLPLHNPFLNEDEINFVKTCIKTTFVSNKSFFVNKFEKKLKKVVKSKYVIAVNSGTAALGICLRALGVKRYDEVITSPLSFVATSNAICHVGAIPHFVDVSKENLGIDFIKLEKYLKKITYIKKGELYNKKTGRRISCMLPVHVFGFPVDIKKMKKIKKQFGLKVLEDSAECLGSFYNKIHLGNFGDMGVLSFNGNKIITTGGGGAIITNNKRLYKISKHIASTAKKNLNFEYDHDKVAWNYIMPGINAALGLAQLNKLKYIISKKKILHRHFCLFFKDYGNEISALTSEKNSKPNFWLNTLIIKKLNNKSRNILIKLLNLKGYEVRPVWKSLNTLPQFKKSPKSNLDNLKLIKNKIINLPSGFDIFSQI